MYEYKTVNFRKYFKINDRKTTPELQLVEYITIFQTKKKYIKKLLKDTI